MKKSYLLALGCALMAGTAVAQNAQEVTYVEDPAQGYIFNKFADNWFIQAEGGVTVGFSDADIHSSFWKRLAPGANLYVGKWFSPILGARVGGEWMQVKGLVHTEDATLGAQPWEGVQDFNTYKTKVNYFGGAFDVMLNLTNWWCGYRPGRVYNAYLYAGGGIYWSFAKGIKEGKTDYSWNNAKDRFVAIRLGLTQEFNLSKHFALGLDLRAIAMPNNTDHVGKNMIVGEALITATYKFNKADWNAPIVPVCPPAENCDEYRARLAEADARIADLENQLRACLNRPVEKVVEKVPDAPLATIYYPCGVYRLTSVDRKVLKSVANAMKADGKDYVLTGYADNYTGTEAINKRLRENRVNTVKNQLVRYGVPKGQLEATTNDNNRVDLGDKCLTLDRCVTIMAK